MNNDLKAKLISYNLNNAEICASAARISTTQGNAVEIFERAGENGKNGELIQKVLRSGHKSIIEHAVFTFALKDVSAFAEQFFIECRLASFTVKSRRYVDFSSFGYYIPPDLAGENRSEYCSYMDALFSAYKLMLENDIPKEDARFLLPYSFKSNFYCTLNARELLHVISDIRYGRGRGIPELQELADQMSEQAFSVFPCIDFGERPAPEHNIPCADKAAAVGDLELIRPQEMGKVTLLNEPSNPAAILEAASRINHPDGSSPLEVHKLLHSERPRELEQLSYSFMVSDITLSGITHIVRHRMQSIIVPSIQEIAHNRVIIPDTVGRDGKLAAIYRDVLESSNELIKKMSGNKELWKYRYYYALSGNVMDIATTMNARELNHFIKLRACSRAQWEVQSISVRMLKHLRVSYPELFCSFGPSCFVDGKCPEGRMACGKMKEIVDKFKELP